MRNLTKTESTLLSLVSNALFDTPFEFDDNVDWNLVEKEANEQAVFSLAFNRHINTIPIEQIKQKVVVHIKNNLSVNVNHIYTHKLMTSNNIPYVILKGCASAYYYPEPIYRIMGDVDFLVPVEYFEQAKELLISEGFVPNPENHICHISFKKADKCIELHFKPSGMPEGKAGEIVGKYFENVFNTAVEAKIDEGKIMLPDGFHHGLVLLLHTCHHLTGEGIGLRHLCDWAVFVNTFSNDEFEAIFKEKLSVVGLWRFAQLLTQLSIKYLGMPEKTWAMENVDDDLLKEMICDIFSGGNFGVKDSSRKKETIVISNRGKDGVGNNSMLKSFVKNINNIVYLKWPISTKLKIILPFGWLFYGTRYLFRIAIGKRDKINVINTVENANKRRNIYKEFHLYEM